MKINNKLLLTNYLYEDKWKWSSKHENIMEIKWYKQDCKFEICIIVLYIASKTQQNLLGKRRIGSFWKTL